jgi:hypothetical protein
LFRLDASGGGSKAWLAKVETIKAKAKGILFVGSTASSSTAFIGISRAATSRPKALVIVDDPRFGGVTAGSRGIFLDFQQDALMWGFLR